MSFRKKYNIKSLDQHQKILFEWFDVYTKAINCAAEENEKNEEAYIVKNNTCPSCNSTKVVEKLIGYKYNGFGGGSTPEKCRHCSDCGNDWVLKEPKHIFASTFLGRWYKQLMDMIEAGETNEKILEVCIYFKDVHAETFKSIYESIWFDYHERVKRIKLEKLRTIFKSVFD
jgi:transcription elongation factor Elf1